MPESSPKSGATSPQWLLGLSWMWSCIYKPNLQTKISSGSFIDKISSIHTEPSDKAMSPSFHCKYVNLAYAD